MKERPVRIQRKRTKGWRMPPNTQYVGRGSKWGNPFSLSRLAPILDIKSESAKIFVVAQYELYLKQHPELVERAKSELRGKNLACWCKPNGICHADVLLNIANEVQS